MNIKVCLLVLIFLQPFSSISEEKLKDNYVDCIGDSERTDQEVAMDLAERRGERDNRYYDDYMRTSRYLNNKDNDDIIKASRGGTAMVIIYLIFTFFLLVLAILVIANVIKLKTNKILLGLGILLWLVYSTFYWASFGTQIRTFRRSHEFRCDYYRLLYNFVYGSTEGDNRYIGIRQEMAIYQTAHGEMPNVTAKTANLNNLKAEDLPGSI